MQAIPSKSTGAYVRWALAGSRSAAGTREPGEVKVWDVDTGNLIYDLTGPRKAAVASRFIPTELAGRDQFDGNLGLGP